MIPSARVLRWAAFTVAELELLAAAVQATINLRLGAEAETAWELLADLNEALGIAQLQGDASTE